MNFSWKIYGASIPPDGAAPNIAVLECGALSPLLSFGFEQEQAEKTESGPLVLCSLRFLLSKFLPFKAGIRAGTARTCSGLFLLVPACFSRNSAPDCCNPAAATLGC